MDDCCAVCAEPLEWVAYGSCAHKDVCSTCVVRLRNVCEDRCCCICKTECNVVFITKALGDYTRNIDFSSLPVDVREGKIGSYWYHEATQAFFDDVDHYRMIKAMCTFSCSVCDKEEHQNDGSRRKANFRNLEQLKGHLYHKHRLVMCRLCLEGRKVFICEQRLYTKAQLNQHINTGDSEVDGTESERGGFMGHPTCEFCRNPFYGDNELYVHMSTEHYTCHICQKQNPGHYEYYRNYDDLELHFRQNHYLCEDEGCLAKKFTVFQSEAELKRHNTLEHGGRLSRSKRNSALQIPTSFIYRRSHESGPRRGRGRNFNQDSSPESQLSMAIQASLESANPGSSRLPDHLPSSSTAHQIPADEDISLIDPLIPPFESLGTDSEPPSRYLQALSHNYNRSGSIQESSFPPLSVPPTNGQQRQQQDGIGLPQNTMAARLRKKNNTTRTNVAQAWSAPTRGPSFPSVSSVYTRPTVPGSSQTNIVTPTVPSMTSYASSVHARPVINNGLSWGGSSNSRNPSGNGKMKHSKSGSNLGESGAFDPVTDFPPVSIAQTQKPSSSGSGTGGGSSSSQAVKVEDVQTANKSLVERIRAALGHDENKYSSFKDISQEYRQGSVDTMNYLEYAKQFGLLELVPDLARLLPDPRKQKELVDAYNLSLQGNRSEEMFWGNDSIPLKEKKNNSKSAKGKKVISSESSKSKDVLADNMLETVRRLQSSYKNTEGEVEVLDKDGYRTSKERPIQVGVSNQGSSNSRAQNELPSNGGNSKTSGDGGGGSGKRGKKTSKFHRIRLGDGSAAALLDLRDPANDANQDSAYDASDGQGSSGLPVRGVWRTGGGQKLFGTSKK